LELLDTLLALKKIFKVDLSIVSNASYESISDILNYFKIEKYFTSIISGNDVINHKPHPDIYLLALKKLDLHSNEVVVFEDTEIGSISARKAGLNVFLISKW
jgi:HAD superfamily hydrolase (TIGR01509 family)